MSEILQEFVDSGSQRLRVDREAGIIRGVKLLGLVSRNGRRYREGALVEAASLYEGAKVNINHPKGHPLSPRDYQDRLGVIRGVEFRKGDGLFGDLHFNPKHTLSEQLVWDAEHAPQNVGLSHNVLARTAKSGEATVVEAITKVQSIDLVADPASTTGLFEHANGRESRVESREPDVPNARSTLDSLTIEQLQLHRPDLLSEIRRQSEVELEELRRQLVEAATRQALSQRRERIEELLVEHGLMIPIQNNSDHRQILSDDFLERLLTAQDEKMVRRLVEERAELVRSARRWPGANGPNNRKPRSRDQAAQAAGPTTRCQTAAEFAAAVRGR